MGEDRRRNGAIVCGSYTQQHHFKKEIEGSYYGGMKSPDVIKAAWDLLSEEPELKEVTFTSPSMCYNQDPDVFKRPGFYLLPNGRPGYNERLIDGPCPPQVGVQKEKKKEKPEPYATLDGWDFFLFACLFMAIGALICALIVRIFIL